MLGWVKLRGRVLRRREFARLGGTCLGASAWAMLTLGMAGAATAQLEFETRQLTEDSFRDTAPQISGNRVVWTSRRSTDAFDASKDEILLWDGAATIPLTDDSTRDFDPVISDANVAWTRGIGADSEIHFWNGSTSFPISDNTVDDGRARIDGSNVVWEWDTFPSSSPPPVRTIGFFNGVSSVMLNSALGVDREPAIDGTRLVWATGTFPTFGLSESLAGGPPTPLVEHTTNVRRPDVSGANVAYELNDGDWDIFLHDGSPTPTRVTTNDFGDFNPQIEGDTVVWWGGIFRDFQIHHYDHASGVSTPLSTGELNQFPQISQGKVVWQGKETNSDDFEIYLWDGSSVHPLTDNDYDDVSPQISGMNITWEGQIRGIDTEIFMAVLCGDTDTDGDSVFDGCDNCVLVPNPVLGTGNEPDRESFQTTTGGQLDDDADGFGNACDAKFGTPGQFVGGVDVGEHLASFNKDRTGNDCGSTGDKSCAQFDLDNAGQIIGGTDVLRTFQLFNLEPGPKCAACPLECTGPNCP